MSLELDKILAKIFILTGIFGLATNMFLLNSVIIINIFMVILLLSSAIWLVTCKQDDILSDLLFFDRDPNSKHSKYYVIILNVIYIILLILSLYSIISKPYSRPSLFLVAISFTASLISAEMFILSKKIYKNRSYLLTILIKIIILGIIIRESLYYQFPSLTADANYHLEFIRKIISDGHVPTKFGLYSSFPLLHIFITSISKLTSLSVVDSFFFIPLSESVGLVFVFFIIKHVFKDDLIALLSMLLIVLSTMNIYFSYFYIGGGTFTFILLLMVLYTIFSNHLNNYKHSLLLISIFLTIVLAHTQTPFILLIVLIVSYLSEIIYKVIQRNYGFRILDPFIILLATLTMLSYWIYVSKFFQSYVVSEFLYFGLRGLPSISHITQGNVIYVVWAFSPVYVSEFFGIIGFLFVLRNLNNYRFNNTENAKIVIFLNVLIFLSVITGIAYVLQLTSLAYIRWLYYVEIFVSVLVAIGILRLSTVFRTQKTRMAVAIILIFFVSSIFLMNPYANNTDDVVPWIKEYTRDAFTLSELSGIGFTKKIREETDSRIFVDTLTYRAITKLPPSPHNPPKYPYSVAGSIIVGETKDFEGFLLLRKEALSNPIIISIYQIKKENVYIKNIYKSKLNPIWYQNLRSGANYNLIYDNPKSCIIYGSHEY